MSIAENRRRFGTSANIRACLAIFALSLGLMAAFLSADLQSYAYDLPVNPMTERIVLAVDTWHGWMERAGFAGLSETISARVAELHDARFID